MLLKQRGDLRPVGGGGTRQRPELLEELVGAAGCEDAAVMGVKTNTALRAVRLLRDEGLLELRQGHGIRVVGTPDRSEVLTKIA